MPLVVDSTPPEALVFWNLKTLTADDTSFVEKHI
jgi:hypothetical protein